MVLTSTASASPAAAPAGTSTGQVSIRIMGSEAERSPNPEAAENVSSQTDENDNLNGNGGAQQVHSDVDGGSSRDSSYQRYDIQQAARWIEQVLPFSLLLLVVFIRQHLQGILLPPLTMPFLMSLIWDVIQSSSSLSGSLLSCTSLIDILRKQTALKGDRKTSVLVLVSVAFFLHVVGVYWWFRNENLLYPLILLPPKPIPPFWHAVFIIMVNVVFLVTAITFFYFFYCGDDTLVRQGAMVLKCLLLIYYKNSRGRSYRKQVHAAGDICVICQEKMHAPVKIVYRNGSRGREHAHCAGVWSNQQVYGR